jgi:hypothetical protein
VRRQHALLVAAVLLALASGCGANSGEGKQLIRTAEEGKQYLDDVLKGAGATARAADDAEPAAKFAVAKAKTVAKIRQTIDDATDPDSGVSQACEAIGTASDSTDIIPPPPNIDDVLPQLRQHPDALSDDDADDLVKRLKGLTGNDVYQLVNAACEGVGTGDTSG